ncbi:MAG: MBL fold metallo-hydrolase [Candidatus Bathyarchaeota archaeon]|nr:MBL fold metallo-hydrolase [Candidatus Bathyarchaeota archaeon A05DMB-5]MDH7557716.1 MBL fold metallo-hydrolase [Candidatus Bathyarchaeota archaeon]
MNVQMFTVGSLLTNCYIVNCEETKEAIIIDPGFDDHIKAEKIFKHLNEEKLTPKFIVNTHGHPDHTCGNSILKEKFHIPILIHEYDAHMLGETGKKIAQFFGFHNFSPQADKLLHDGDTVKIGNTLLKVIHTPGHSRGSISLLGKKEIFTGDTLFMGSIGRVDFPESSERDMKNSLRKIAQLPENLTVYPGHGPTTTTIGEEKHANPFLQWL